MGNACKKDDTVTSDLPGLTTSLKGKVSDDPTLVLPDLSQLRSLIDRKTGEMDVDITRSERGTSAKSELSLLLPACKDYSPTLLIKYFLIYSFYIGKYTDKGADKPKYQQLFYELLGQVVKEPKEKELIAQLKADLQKQSNDAKQCLKVINYAFKSSFILEYLNKVLLLSNDPKDLAYFIFPIYAFNNGIKLSYHKSSYARRKDPVWIVAVLQSRQIEILKAIQNRDNYFFFSAFIRGFTQEKYAEQQFKSLRKSNKNKTFLFTVNFPYSYSALNSSENNGYFIDQGADTETKKRGDIIFNIMSSFKLSSKTETYKYDVDYGELAAREYKKIADRDYGKEPILLKIYELCRGISKYYLKSQSCLFRITKGTNQSLKVSNLVLSGTKATNLSSANDIQRENIINTHIDMGQYDEALKKAEERDTLLFKAKKIQILFRKDKTQEVKQQLTKISESQKKSNIEARLMLDQIAARLEINNGQYKKAHERLKSLYEALQKAYPNDFQYIGREVIDGLMECEKRGGLSSSLEKYEKEGVNWFTSIGGTSLQLSSVSVMK